MAIIIGFISEVMVVIYVPNCMYNPYCAPQVQREKERERGRVIWGMFLEKGTWMLIALDFFHPSWGMYQVHPSTIL